MEIFGKSTFARITYRNSIENDPVFPNGRANLCRPTCVLKAITFPICAPSVYQVLLKLWICNPVIYERYERAS